MHTLTYSCEEAATSLAKILGKSGWEAVGLACGYLAILRKETDEEAARAIREHGGQTFL